MTLIRSHGRRIAAVVALLVLLYVPFYETPYINGQITLIFVIGIAILGLNLIAGYTGQLSVAQSLFLGVGGYTSAILVQHTGIPLLLTIPAAGLVALALGWVIAIPVLRLRGFYLMVVTLALVFVMSPLIKDFPDLTGGQAGLLVAGPPPPGGLAGDQYVYMIALVVGLVLVAVAARLVHSQYGPAMIAIRDNEPVAEAIGIRTTRVKVRVFAFSAGFGGVAGSIYVLVIGYVSPDSFGLTLGLALFAGAFIGGISTISGALIGAAFVQVVPLLAGDVNTSLTGVLYGAAVIVSIMAFPNGLAGLGLAVGDRLRRRGDATAPAAPPTSEAAKEPKLLERKGMR